MAGAAGKPFADKPARGTVLSVPGSPRGGDIRLPMAVLGLIVGVMRAWGPGDEGP